MCSPAFLSDCRPRRPFGHLLDLPPAHLQDPAPVVLGPAGLRTNIAQGAADADQPLHLEVQVLVLRLPHQNLGATEQSHGYQPLAGIPKVALSATGK